MDFIPYSNCSSLFKHWKFCIQAWVSTYMKVGMVSLTSESELPFTGKFPWHLNYSYHPEVLLTSTPSRRFLVLISKCYSTSSLNFLFWCYIGYLHKIEELSQILLLPLQSYWPPWIWTGVNEGRIWRNRVVQYNYISTVQHHQKLTSCSCVWPSPR